MELCDCRYLKIVSRDKRSVEMLLYGVIGEDVNGHLFAQELNYLGREYDEIKIRINSEGGSVVQGLSIASEMMNSNAFIIAHVDGVAASMAAALLPAADRVTMNDYAKVMVHSPYYIDEDGQAVKNLSAKDKKGITALKNTLISLLKKRGIADDAVNAMMRTDSWYNADEAVTAKLVDEVITTGKKQTLAAVEPKRLVALVMTEISNQNSDKKSMKKVIASLNLLGASLDENATEDQVTAAINKVIKPAEPAKVPDKLIDKLLAVGKLAGTVTDKNEAAFRTLAATNMDLFVDMLDIESVEAPTTEKPATAQTTRLSDAIAAVKKGAPQAVAADEHDFAWYEKNAPQALAKMEVTDPEKFKKLQTADLAKFE